MAVVTEKDIREMADEWGGLMLKIGPKVRRIAAIERKVKDWLKTNPRKKIRITGEFADAVKDEKQGDRQLSVAAFLTAAADADESDRNACLKVAMKEAEDLLGKTKIDAIATRPTVPDISLKLKEV